jgi:hypothetical protein
MSEPICGVMGSTSAACTSSSFSATVLCTKRYPREEFGVILHGTGVVITLRDVQMFMPVQQQSQGPASGLSGSYNTRDIKEGTELVLHDVGVWNVTTTALHRARVTIVDKEDRRSGLADNRNSTNPDEGNEAAGTKSLPVRRKQHMSMV